MPPIVGVVIAIILLFSALGFGAAVIINALINIIIRYFNTYYLYFR